MTNTIDQVKRLKLDAKADRDFEDYGEAIEKIKRAVKLLEIEIPTAQPEYRQELERQLADCYGIWGGLLRRMEDFNASIAKYKEGLKYETDDSYNLSNSIVVSIILDPTQLETQRENIRSGIQTVQQQVEGPRKSQWWAWADLGLFQLLVGEWDAAIRAYAEFDNAGARAADYDSHIAVLNDLKTSFEKHDRNEIKALIEKAIDYLNRNKPTA